MVIGFRMMIWCLMVEGAAACKIEPRNGWNGAKDDWKVKLGASAKFERAEGSLKPG